VSVALQYIDSWLAGNGAAAIYNLMEDAATAEIARSLLWTWKRNGSRVNGVSPFLAADYEQFRDDELGRLGDGLGHMAEAKHILDSLVLNDEFIDFLTLPAYGHLD
jgi:malate synthase